jgi:ubiquinone/menaquinone biosynthesis C-methylase UbiE
MSERVCPWWLGYLLASPIRRWISDTPEKLLGPFIHDGMTVLEPGPGMGYFTLPLARMVGPRGRVVAIDIQPQMLNSLRRRAAKKGLAERIETRLAAADRLGLEEMNGAADFALAFAVVHEMPSVESFFLEVAAALKPGALLFFAEPSGHVSVEAFQRELDAAQAAGLKAVNRPPVRHSHAAVLKKSN